MATALYTRCKAHGLPRCNASERPCRFKQDHDAIDTVTQLASDMRVYAPHHVLVGGYLHDKWDPHLVEQLVSLMAPDREGMRVDVQTSDFDSLKGAFATTFEVRPCTNRTTRRRSAIVPVRPNILFT